MDHRQRRDEGFSEINREVKTEVLQNYSAVKMSRYYLLSFLLIAVLLGDALGNSSVNPRLKRALYHRYGHHSSKLSLKDLALELAQLHLRRMIVDEKRALEKRKESGHIFLRDCCTYIKFVVKPVFYKAGKNTQGAWMKDPLGIMGAETIFVMEGHGPSRVLQEFENMGKLKVGTARKTYKLTYKWDGTGAVVYGPYLYYNRADTNFIVKYNLRTERVEAQLRVSGFIPRKNMYAWGGSSGMDLAADEQGLWVLWGSTSNSYRLYASKIDVHKNVITYVWALNTEKMRAMGNAFVAYGVIYTIKDYNSRSTTINFAYDTKTGRQWNPNIQFTNQYGYNSMVAYNPRERVLYAWDNKRLVTYPITFY